MAQESRAGHTKIVGSTIQHIPSGTHTSVLHARRELCVPAAILAQSEHCNFHTLARFHFTSLTSKNLRVKPSQVNFDKPKKTPIKQTTELPAPQSLRTIMLFLPETVSGPLLGKTLNPTPQVLGAAGRKKADFKQVPSIISYWVKCKRLLDPGSFNKTFSFPLKSCKLGFQIHRIFSPARTDKIWLRDKQRPGHFTWIPVFKQHIQWCSEGHATWGGPPHFALNSL